MYCYPIAGSYPTAGSCRQFRRRQQWRRRTLSIDLASENGEDSGPKLSNYIQNLRNLFVNVVFDRFVMNERNKRIALLSSNGFNTGYHEWFIEVVKCDIFKQEIGVVGRCDIDDALIDDDFISGTTELSVFNSFLMIYDDTLSVNLWCQSECRLFPLFPCSSTKKLIFVQSMVESVGSEYCSDGVLCVYFVYTDSVREQFTATICKLILYIMRVSTKMDVNDVISTCTVKLASVQVM